MRIVLCLLLVLLPLHAYSQIVISQPIDDSSVQTISGEPEENRKSLPAAIGLSVLLPGSGEAYLGNSFRQKIFLTSELVLLALTGVSYILQEHYYTASYSYAAHNAGAINAPRDIEFLETMEKFRSRAGVDGQNVSAGEFESYNMYQLRLGLPTDNTYPDTPDYSWDWGTSDDPENTRKWNRYSALLDNYRRSVIVLKASIGALILNRVISAVSVVQYYKSNAYIKMHAAPYIVDDQPGVMVVVGF